MKLSLLAKFCIRGSLWDIWFWILPCYAMRLRYFRIVLENHIALLFQRSYSKITSRCSFTEVTRNHMALLFQRSYSKITSRCYFIEALEITLRCYSTRNYSKSHRVAISTKVWIVFRDLMIFILNGKNFQWNRISIRRSLGQTEKIISTEIIAINKQK